MRILITGCAKPNNIGFMLAERFKEENPDCGIIAINHPLNLHDRKNNGELISSEYPCDLSDVASIMHTCSLIKTYEGEIDIFIHAAGLSSLSWFDSIDYREFNDTITVNSIAPVVIVKELSEELTGGSCLFISSNAATIPMRCSLAYNMSKAALTMAMKQMARELTRTKNMTIFSISPNKLHGTGMSEITDEIVPLLRGWSKEDAEVMQNNAIPNGKQTDPRELCRFIFHMLSVKERHQMMSGCDIQYGV